MTATEVLTLVLVLVTGYYAWQNRKMAKEMAAARKITVLPKLALEWTMISPTIAIPTLKNVGPGPALDLDISIHYNPLPDKHDRLRVRRWTASLMTPGESKQFLPGDKDDSSLMDTSALSETYETVQLAGEYKDALGELHVADDTLTDIKEWRRISGEAIARWQDPDLAKRQAREMAEQLAKKFKPTLDAIAKGLPGR